MKRLQPCIIKHGEAIRLRAKQDLIDKKGKYATNKLLLQYQVPLTFHKLFKGT